MTRQAGGPSPPRPPLSSTYMPAPHPNRAPFSSADEHKKLEEELMSIVSSLRSRASELDTALRAKEVPGKGVTFQVRR